MNVHTLMQKVAYLKLLTEEKHGEFRKRLTLTRPNKWFYERVVFSYLAYRSRIGTGATVRKIAKETSISPRTVSTALKNLNSLVAKNGRTVSLNDPDPQWFLPLENHEGEHWSDGCCYVGLLVPRKAAKITYRQVERRFGINHSAVFSILISLSGKSAYTLTTATGISTLLNGIHRKTISSVLVDLDQLGLITRETFGDRMRVNLLDIKESHLDLFRLQPERQKIEKKEPTPPADRNEYELRGDGYDERRRVCIGLMTQRMAEQAIELSKELNETDDQFLEFFSQIKARDQKNRESGKQARSNIGAFLISCYKGRVEAIRQARAEQEALESHQQWLRSDEFQEQQRREQEDAAADPLHKRHVLTTDSILERVKFDGHAIRNHQAAASLLNDYERHLRNFMVRDDHVDPLIVRQLSLKVARSHLCLVLADLNHHYTQKTWASTAEFVAGINRVLRNIEQDVPTFEWSSVKEVAHA
ncbi:hypothetical protein CA54_41340 [Symmachiella macrocystis]|uniref:Uncharacterized protein n=1 Tax=Symmachiella macrocystis TaxID=2527985 RepID=A0A5C6B9E1_9PLAN|nr:hypothetical protein [Symmachiella macrocystis]TWU08895.1 hypothetical protein CA54_41340 [Symmachiella macrocystis]